MAVIRTVSNRVITTVQIGDAPQTIVDVPDNPAADGRHVLPPLRTADEVAGTSLPLTTTRAPCVAPPLRNHTRHKARHQRAQVLSTFLASVPKLR